MAGRVPTHIMLGLVGFLITLFGPGHTTRSYHLSDYWTEFNITLANDYCKSLDGYLMEINSREEYEQIKYFINEKRLRVNVFLGLNDSGHQGVWTWYNSGQNATDLGFAEGEPNNQSRHENCSDFDFHEAGRFLCEIPDSLGPGHTTGPYHFSYYLPEFNITTANDYCKSLDGYLMEINSREEYRYIRNLIIEKEPRVTVFLGGIDIGNQGVWTWYNSGQNATHLSWAEGEPNNWHGHENCMTVNPSLNYQLNDLDCHEPGTFLCEIPDFGPGHTPRSSYNLSSYWIEFNITAANDYCKSLDGYLMEINSREEFELIRNMIIDDSRNFGFNLTVYLGGNDIGHQGVWTWYNSGKNATNLSWAEGEPNNQHGHENCMTVNPWQNFQLNNLDCHEPGKILCEIPDLGPCNITSSYYLTDFWWIFNITTANDICRSLNGYLMEINSREEYVLIRNLIIEKDTGHGIYLGGNDIGHEGVWTWYNSGKNATHLSWAEGEPNNRHGHENCMVVNPRDNIELNDTNCHAPGRFLCEIPDCEPIIYWFDVGYES